MKKELGESLENNINSIEKGLRQQKDSNKPEFVEFQEQMQQDFLENEDLKREVYKELDSND